MSASYLRIVWLKADLLQMVVLAFGLAVAAAMHSRAALRCSVCAMIDPVLIILCAHNCVRTTLPCWATPTRSGLRRRPPWRPWRSSATICAMWRPSSRYVLAARPQRCSWFATDH
eukprot:scaffold673881_cov61-Prasinocladus_malaysianus.AAC.1